MRLAVRAILAFILLPGLVAYVVPLWLAPGARSTTIPAWVGAALVVAGMALLLWCTREFAATGRGTLAPWSPPTRIVTTGPYRRTRNPMYVAVVLVILGWSAFFGSGVLLAYCAAMMVAFHFRVILYEEPRLEASFAE